MSVLRWTNAAGGQLLDSGNWQNGTAPGAGDSALVDLPGYYNIAASTIFTFNSFDIENTSVTFTLNAPGTAASALGSLINTGRFQIDHDYDNSGSQLVVTGTLSNSNYLSLGTGYNNLQSDDSVTTAHLTGTGEVDVFGANGATAPKATFEVSGDAAPATLSTTLTLSGHAQFDYGGGGGIIAIGPSGSLSLTGPDARVTSGGDDSHSSALDGLTSNAGQLGLNDAALNTTVDEDFANTGNVSIENGGSLGTRRNLTNSGRFQLDRDYNNSGSQLVVTGTLSNSNYLSLGTGYNNLQSDDSITTAHLTGTGEIDVFGANGATAPKATFEVSGDAAPATLSTTLTLSGHAQFDYGGGGRITAIGPSGSLSLTGPDARITSGGDDSHSSALDGLTSNAGQLTLNGAALETTAGEDFTNSGNVSIENGGALGTRRNLTSSGRFQLDRDYDNSGSQLVVTGTLSNSNYLSLGTGYNNLQSDDSITTAHLTGTGEIDVFGANGATAPKATFEVTVDAAPTTLSTTLTLSGHAQFDYGAGGGISAIGPSGALSLTGPDARVTSGGDDSHSSALDGLASNAGQLTLNGAALTTTAGEDFTNSGNVSIEDGGSLGTRRNLTNSGRFQLDRDYDNSGSQLVVTGTLSNSNYLSLGTGYNNLQSDDSITTAHLTGTGEIDVFGANGATAPKATFEVTGDAAPAVLDDTLSLSGHAEFDYGGGGGIATVAKTGTLTLSGADARLTSGGDDSFNSALLGLDAVAGSLLLNGDASVRVGGDLDDTGNLQLDRNYADGGATLTVAGTLTNSGYLSLGTGYNNLQSNVTVTTAHLVNTGEIDLFGAYGATAPEARFEVTLDAAPTTLSATLALSGHAQLDFGSGSGVTTIASTGALTLGGVNAHLTSGGDDSFDSALLGLDAVAGSLLLNGDANVRVGGDLDDTGTLQLDRNYADGGATLTVAGTLTNSGLLTLGTGYANNSAAVTLSAARLVNSGTVQLYGGPNAVSLTSQSASNGGIVGIHGGATLQATSGYTQSAGLTENGGTLTAATVTLAGGTLDGTGTVRGSVVNDGAVVEGGTQPTAPGLLTVTGSYTEESGATLAENILSATSVSTLAVEGGVTLDGGSLNIATPTGFSFALGQSFTVLSFAPGSLSGRFGALHYGSFLGTSSYVAVGTGLYLQADYNDAGGSVQLEVVGTPPIQPAAPVIAPAAVAIGNVHVGDPGTVALTVENAAVMPADVLDLTIDSVTPGDVATGSITGLAAGDTDAASVRVGIDTGSVGDKSGSATLHLVSDGGGGVLAPLPDQTETISGAVYRLAAPTLSGIDAIVHVGDTGAFGVQVGNADPADGYSETATARISGVSGSIAAASAATVRVAPGATAALGVSVATTAAGVFGGTATIDIASDGGVGSGSLDGLGSTTLGSRSVGVSLTVDNYAAPTFTLGDDGGVGGAIVATGDDAVLDLGTVARGSGPLAVSLGLANTAAGLADLLAGTFLSSGSSAFSVAGLGAFTGLGAGQSDNAPIVTLDTSADGTFTETLTLDGVGSNASGYSAALAPRTLTIRGVVADLPAPTITAPGSDAAFAGVATTLGTLSVADSDPGGSITVTVTDSVGILTAQAAGFVRIDSSNNQHRLVLSGTLADINATLASLTYLAAAAGSDTVTVSAQDGHRAGSSKQIAISTAGVPSNIAPVVQVPDSLTLIAGTTTGVPGISVVVPPGADPNTIYQFSISSAGSELVVTGGAGGTVTGQGTDHLVITGTAAEINSYFDDGLSDALRAIFLGISFILTSLSGNPSAAELQKEIVQVITSIDEARKKRDELAAAVKAAQNATVAEEVAEDVHVVTSTGAIFQLDAVGEFTLAKSTASGSDFDVQVRTGEINGSTLGSVVTAVAAGFGADAVFIAAGDNVPLMLNGAAATLAVGATLSLASGHVTRMADSVYELFWNTGESVMVFQDTKLLNLRVGFGVGDTSASIVGLVGPGRPLGSLFTLPDGTILTGQVSAQSFADYVNALRVTDASSRLVYGSGQSTATFTDASAPHGSLDLSALPASVLALAAAAVAAAGITDPGVAAAAEQDFLLGGGDTDAVQTDAVLFAGRTTAPAPVTPPPAVAAFGVVAEAASVTSPSSGPTTANFTAYLSGVAAADTIVDYAVVAAGDGDLDAAAFGGTLPSGTVTIAAGTSSARFSIAVPQGALGTATSETLVISATPRASVPIINTTASSVIIQPTAGTPPTIAVSSLASFGTFSKTGNTYSLDLGTIPYGSIGPRIEFSIANGAPLGADALGGTFAAVPVIGFSVSGAVLPAPIAAGQSYNGLTLTLNESKFGANAETIVFDPTDTNTTGFSKPLDPITLTVSYTLEAPTMAYSQAWGDVHIITYNNLKYDFQAVGEFVLAHSTAPGDSFDIQLRLTPLNGSSSISIITEVGLGIGTDRVTFAIGRATTVWLDGVPSTVSATTPVLKLAGGTVSELSATTFKVVWNTGETATITQTGICYSVVDGIPTAETGSVSGLQGENEGQAADFQLPDGTVLPQPLSAETLYHEYADAWRVSPATSLFDYAPGQTTATFTNHDFPSAPLNPASLPAPLQAQAAAVVAAAGITDPAIAQSAILDYLATGDPSLVAAAAIAQDQAGSTTSAVITPPAATPQAISVTAVAASLTELAVGATDVAFTITLATPATAALTVDYAVVTPDASFLGAAAFQGTLPSGQVTFAAGQSSASVVIAVPRDALGTNPTGGVALAVTATDATPVAIPRAQTVLVNGMPEPGTPAQPTFINLTDAPGSSFVQSGDTYTLDLGTLIQGQTGAVVNVALSNNATLPADALSGTFGVPTGDGFVVTGNTLPAPVAAGALYTGLFADETTDTLGAHVTTLTFNPRDINPSGYQADLTPITLVLKDVVGAAASLAVNTPMTIVFPNVRVGTDEARAVSVSNPGAAGSAPLDVTPVATGAATATGTVTGLAAGATDATDLQAGLATTAAGSLSGTVMLDGRSELGAGQSVAIPNSPVIDVFGSVFRVAAPSIAPTVAFLHVGDPGTVALDVRNTAAADGYSESLVASVSGTTGDVAAGSSGPTPELAAGAEDTTSLSVGVSTATAGVRTGNATVALVSDGGIGPASIDGLGQVDLSPVAVPISVTVNNYAVAQFASNRTLAPGASPNSYVIDLGTVKQGDAAPTATLEALNAIAGPADDLNGIFTVTGDSAFTTTGFGAFASLGAGGLSSGSTVTLSTKAAGTFSETIVLHPGDSNAGGFSKMLADQTVTIRGTVSKNSGTASDDVHMVAFDGQHYDFQALGDFILARSASTNGTFGIEIHTVAYPSRNLTSVITKEAAQVGSDLVTFGAGYVGVSINGVADKALSAAHPNQLLAGGELKLLAPNHYELLWSSGESLMVTNMGSYLNDSVSLGPQDGPGSVQGLLGSNSGPSHDFELPDGSSLAKPVSDNQILTTFADAWRVQPTTSLLANPAGLASRTGAGFAGPVIASEQSGDILTGSLRGTATSGPGVTIEGSLADLMDDVVTNFAAHDLIRVTGLDGILPTASITGAPGQGDLVVSAGSARAVLHLIGTVPLGAPHVAADHNGGALISLG